MVAQRRAFIGSIKAGQFKTEATLAQLRHNHATYLALKKDDEAEKTLAQLRKLEVHLEEMRTLRLQQEAAKRSIADSKKLDALSNQVTQLEAEVSELESDSDSSTSTHIHSDRRQDRHEDQKPTPNPAPSIPVRD